MKPITVSQFNEYIAQKLRSDLNLQQLPVQGEINGLNKSGQHYYFTLRDKKSSLKCNIWGSNAVKIDMSLVQNGKSVIVIGDISPYPKGGYYSFSVRFVQSIGEGDLLLELERIKKKLSEEGLFDPKWKKPIPSFPLRIGVITAATGAAIEDIKKIITAKNNLTDIIIFPTQVQGIGAPDSICSNINLANKLSKEGFKIDTLIVGRGGGSAEDLAAFNDENVARAIFASEIPVISAVGHESDVSISDFVADIRAETPTAAADMAVMDTGKLIEDILRYRELLLESTRLKLAGEREKLSLKTDLLFSNTNRKISDAKNEIDKLLISLKENNPLNILSKGYAAVLDDNNHIISDIDNLVVNNNYIVKMNSGDFTAKVIKIRKDNLK
ncbi:MAG TPA: exodeoxyribonuclease VII large subunit [Mogibacterium sp.]|nr:exodeoxyribonuclease VII large subunit [Mogibacterium sp.]